jgi:hypothetical protein
MQTYIYISIYLHIHVYLRIYIDSLNIHIYYQMGSEHQLLPFCDVKYPPFQWIGKMGKGSRKTEKR